MSKSFNWMPILKTGTFTAKNGKKVTFQESDLDKIVSNTDLTTEPQFVVEHPRYDKLGFGTISELKRIGNYLFALPKHVEEKFKNAVNSGELPGRSVSIDDTNFGLSSIGFLPKEISPAVDGLGSYAFSSENTEAKLLLILPGTESHFAEIENDRYEFSLQHEVSQWPFKNIKGILRNLKNLLIEKFSKEEADQVIPEFDLEETGNPPTIFNTPDPKPIKNDTQIQYSTNTNGDKMKIDLSKFDLSKIPQEIKNLLEAMKEEVISLEANLTSTKTELQSATTKISAAEMTKNRTEVLQFCESEEMKLRILPAEKEKTIQMLLAAKEKGVLEFSSGDAAGTKIQLNAYEHLKETLKQLPVKIELQEFAIKEKTGDQQLPYYKKIANAISDCVNKK
jgi:hypothetical protein